MHLESRCRSILFLVLWAALALPMSAQTEPTTTTARLQETYGKLPLTFEANQGQSASQVKFLSRGSGYTLFLTSTEAILALRIADCGLRNKKTDPQLETRNSKLETILRMKLVGANPAVQVVGLDALPAKTNYFIGNDSQKWRTAVPNYARVEYRDVYPGVNLVYHGSQRQLEYDFILAPGVAPRAIKLAFEGAQKIRIDAQGDLILHTPGGELRQHKPLVYQEVNGVKRAIPGRYVLRGKQVGFQVAAYDTSRPLVIDPVLAYSTYLGGRGDDQGVGIAIDAAGNAYITGKTNSPDFPTASAAQTALGGFRNAFVTKLNAAGALVYSTYLGGRGTDEGAGIAVDLAGNAYVTGSTDSPNFPIVNALQGSLRGFTNAFVTKLNATGAIAYSTYLGGSTFDEGFAIAVDATGNSYLAGSTNSTDFPLANPVQPVYGGGVGDAFVAKLNAAGNALVYSTYLGGSRGDEGLGIAVDGAGNAYVTGSTNSTNFPLAHPFQPTFRGLRDAFVTKLTTAGALIYSTYLGGNGFDFGFGIAVDAAGNAYITGNTDSTNFPTASPLQATLLGVPNAFVTKLNAAGSALVYSTYLGGSRSDNGAAIAVDAAGNAYVTGDTQSADFPTVNPIQATFGGSFDAFVAKLNVAGGALGYSTYLGGRGQDVGSGIAVDAAGNAYVVGSTDSANFPTANPLQPTLGGRGDAFVAKIGNVVLCALVCPSDQTANTGPGAERCGTIVTYPAPTVSGACGAVNCTPASGVFFPVGTTPITCTAAAGPTCTFNSTVRDTTAPRVTAQLNPLRRRARKDDDDDDGDEKGRFRVNFSAADNCDRDLEKKAVMEIPEGSAGFAVVFEREGDGDRDDEHGNETVVTFNTERRCIRLEGRNEAHARALLATMQRDGGAAVQHGQVLRLDKDDDPVFRFVFRNGVLQSVAGPRLRLKVTARDRSGNVGAATATPVFRRH